MKNPISITAISSISALGSSPQEVWNNYQNSEHFITEKKFENTSALVAQIDPSSISKINALKAETSKYRSLDDSVLFGIFSARQAIQQAQWSSKDNFGVNIGSSRGATQLFEHFHDDFLATQKAQTLSSPTTTLGNISSWIAHDLQTKGPEISHSITCSTALHAMLNGIAWIQSGMSDSFLVGGSEASLTAFTIAQMKALKIYNSSDDYMNSFPCLALDLSKTQNTMILGEGASMACLEKGKPQHALATIEGIGYATEILEHNASLSTDAICFQRSMKMALKDINTEDIDIIITHTPGTIKGDQAEYNAIKKIFGKHIPSLTTNKWKLGHTLGASGMLSVEMAILMLIHQKFIPVPFIESDTPKKIEKVLINAVGFGGNAVSILLSK